MSLAALVDFLQEHIVQLDGDVINYVVIPTLETQLILGFNLGAKMVELQDLVIALEVGWAGGNITIQQEQMLWIM